MTIAPMIGYTAGLIIERFARNKEAALIAAETAVKPAVKEISNRFAIGIVHIESGLRFNNAELAAEHAGVPGYTMRRHAHGFTTRVDLSSYIPLHQMVPQKEQ